MKALALAAAFALAVPLHAQDLAPELAPLAAKHQADLTALDAQKAAAVTRAQQPYVSALDGAERTATSAGTLEVVAAITKEREALKSGVMSPSFPEGLPKALQSTRKSCLDAMARVGTDAAPRQKAIDADYFRALASLQTKAAAKPELAQQIAAEKEKLLANADAGDPLETARQIETLLTSKVWLHHGQYHYRFTKNGRIHIDEVGRGGRFEIDGKTGFVSFLWDNNEFPGEGLQFNRATKKFEHNKVGDFVPAPR
jgi:hypothetical protein